MKVLVIDTETGGLDPEKHSILTAAGVVLDFTTGNIKELFHIMINEGSINANFGALKVNNINLNDIIAHGLSPQNAVSEIEQKLANEFGDRSMITLAGHNVGFDIAFFKRLYKLAENNNFENRFMHRNIDTASIIQFLQLSGKADPKEKANLDFLLKFANIELEKNVRHTALGDAIVTAQALRNLTQK